MKVTWSSAICRNRAEDDDDGEEDEDDRIFTHLHVEIMGRHSNLILVSDEGLIMESVRRVSSSMSRVRPIAPRLRYTPPPVQIKDDPRRATEAPLLIDWGPLRTSRGSPGDWRRVSRSEPANGRGSDLPSPGS